MALYSANFLFHVNSPNLKPRVHLLIILRCHDLPEYILISKLIKVLGIIEERQKIFFSAILKMGCLLYKKIFFQKKGAQNNNFRGERGLFNKKLFKFSGFSSRSSWVFYGFCTTTVRVIDWVHSHASNKRFYPKRPSITCFSVGTVFIFP